MRANDVRASLPEHCALLALVETARGVRDVAALCDSRSIDRVAFGSVDFAVELGLPVWHPEGAGGYLATLGGSRVSYEVLADRMLNGATR